MGGYLCAKVRIRNRSTAIENVKLNGLSSGFQTCLPHPLIPDLPWDRHKQCSANYVRHLPTPTTPITVSVIYYYPWKFTDPYRIGHRTTSVFSDSWPIFLPAQTRVSLLSVAHFVIRWREGDFNDGPASPSDSGVPDPQQPTLSLTPTTTASLPGDPPAGALPSDPATGTPPPPLWSRGATAGLVLGTIVSIVALCLGAVRLQKRRKQRGAPHRPIELDRDRGDGMGFRVVHQGDGPNTEAE